MGFATALAEESRSAFYSWEIQAGTLRRVQKRRVGDNLVTSQSGSTIPGESCENYCENNWTKTNPTVAKKMERSMLDDMSSARVPSVEVSLNPPWPLNTLLSIDLFLAASSSQEQYRVRSADCDMYNVLFQAWQHHRLTIVFKALHRRPDALTCVDIEARVPSMMETCHPGEAMSFYARRPQGTATHMPHCRTMSDYVMSDSWGADQKKRYRSDPI